VKQFLFLAALLVATTAWASDKPPAHHAPGHHADVVTSATFQYIDYTGCAPLWNPTANQPITATATQTTAYLDCGGHPYFPPAIPLTDGVTDGQLLTIVCNSSLDGGWTIGGSFDDIDTLLLGGSNLGSFDQGLTVNPGNGSSSSDQSCGATLMWSNSNQWWELVTIYGGTDN
jgi:hypothetical protein